MSQSWSHNRRPNGYELTDDELKRRVCSTVSGGRTHLRGAFRPDVNTSCGRRVDQSLTAFIVIEAGWPECKTCFAWARGGTLC